MNYITLQALFPLRPIETEEENKAAIELVFDILSKEKITKDEKDYVRTLSSLINEFEEKNTSLRKH